MKKDQNTRSKKAAKKEAAKAKKLRLRQEHAASSGVSAMSIDGPGPLAANYGDVPLMAEEVATQQWTGIGYLAEELKDESVLIRGPVPSIRAVSKKMAFVVERERGFTVQCVLTVKPELVSLQMVKFATNLSKESFVDIEKFVSIPVSPLKATTQQVEIQVTKIHCINKAAPTLPINRGYRQK